MTDIKDTALATLEQQGRLLNAVLKGPTERPGRFGFRGEIALKFAPQFADESARRNSRRIKSSPLPMSENRQFRSSPATFFLLRA